MLARGLRAEEKSLRLHGGSGAERGCDQEDVDAPVVASAKAGKQFWTRSTGSPCPAFAAGAARTPRPLDLASGNERCRLRPVLGDRSGVLKQVAWTGLPSEGGQRGDALNGA